MNIEDELKNIAVKRSSNHKEILKIRLKAHMNEQKTPRSRWSKFGLVAAGGVLALIIILGITFGLPGLNQNGQPQNPIVQLLTPQQVLAAASEIAETNAQNRYFYQKVKNVYAINECDYEEDKVEYWFDAELSRLLKVTTNKFGDISEYAKWGKTGLHDPFTAVYTVEETLQKRLKMAQDNPNFTPCIDLSPLSDADRKKYDELVGHLPDNYHERLIGQGNPSEQAKVLEELMQVKGFNIKEDVQRSEWPKPLIGLTLSVSWAYETIFFDQETKQFVGIESQHPDLLGKKQSTFVIEQRIYNPNEVPEFPEIKQKPLE